MAVNTVKSGFVSGTYANTATDSARTPKLGTFTPPPTRTPTPSPLTGIPSGPHLGPPLPTGYQPSVTPGSYAKQYCVDEAPKTVLIESCDDATRCDVAHGDGGPIGLCGTVISWEHAIIEFLLGSTQNKLTKDLSAPIQSSCYTAAPYSPYISTFNVIDAYNLAGLREFSRGTHASAVALDNAWRTTVGYTISLSAMGVAPGDVLLFSNPPHVAIVNTVEVPDRTRGNGEIWFLHTNTAYYLGKVIIANWVVVASSTGDNSVTFGSHQLKGADVTRGETVCYCESGVCYRYVF